MKTERNCRRVREGRQTAFATPGPESFRQSGETASASSASTTRSTTRIRRARTGTTGRYFAGDGALLAEDGYFRILGRGCDQCGGAPPGNEGARIRRAWTDPDEVAEAAVVPVVDEIKGRMPEVYIALKPGVTTPHKEVAEKVIRTIETMIGKIAGPRLCGLCPTCPRRAPGNCTCRALAAISNTLDVDITTLANPDAWISRARSREKKKWQKRKGRRISSSSGRLSERRSKKLR